MKKGFTLIELLAVIVILAIIALIATPIVLGIIEDVKESAQLRSAEMYLSGVEQAIMKENMNAGGNFKHVSCDITSEGNLYCDNNEDIIELEMNGELPKNGKITFENGKIKEVKLIYENATIIKNSKGELVKADCESLGNYEHKLKDGTIESHDTKEGNCSKCGETVLAPGLYDENDNLMISWSNLLSKNYQPITYWYYEDYYDEEKDEWIYIEEERTSGILNVDSNGVLSGVFDTWDYENKSAEYLVGKLIIDDKVTKIGESAFYNCTNLTEVIMPNSIVSIGASSFSDCTGLTNISFSKKITNIGSSAFGWCRNLKSVKIPNSITSIESSAFYCCVALTSIEIPDSVEKIGQDAFYNCSALTKVNINDLSVWCKINFENTTANPIYYAKSLYLNDQLITNLTIPNEIISIGNNAFYNCLSLTSLDLGNDLQNIGNNAFYNCSNLTTVNIENNVQSIGNNAFYNCSNLTTVNIGNNVQSIGNQAFAYCKNLEKIKVSEENKKYDSRDNCNGIIETSTNTLILGCKNTIIPNTVTNIASYAFSGSTGLTEIEIPRSVTTLSDYAFYGCTGLTSITIPNSVITISGKPFYNCSSKLMIYCEINKDEIPSTWGSSWKYYGYGGCPPQGYHYLAVTWADGTVTSRGSYGNSCPF